MKNLVKTISVILVMILINISCVNAVDLNLTENTYNSNTNTSSTTNQSTTSSYSNTNNTSSQKGVYLVGSNTVLYGDGTNTYVLSNGSNVGEVSESNGTVYIRYTDGTIKTWKTASKGSTVVLTTIATSTKALTKDSNGNVTGYITNDGKVTSFTSNNTTTNSSQYLAIQNGQATLLIWENNNISKTYSLANKDVVWGYQDSNRTCYLKKQDGSLLIWNYDLQKSDSKIKLLKVDSKVKDAIVSNNFIIGYTVDGSSTMRNTWSLDQVKIAIAIDNANSTTNNNTNSTNNTNKPVVYASRVDKDGSYTCLYNSKGEKVDYFKLSNGKLIYHGWVIKNVSSAYFNKKGNLIIKIKNTKTLKSINHNSMALKTITKYTKKIQTSSDFATYVVKTNGKKVKLAKY